MTRRSGAVAAALGLAALLAAAPAAPAQRPQPGAADRSAFLEGTHAFRRILYDGTRHKLTPLRDVAAVTDPTRALIVVLGDPEPLDGLNTRMPGAGSLRGFVEAGGALLVATDRDARRGLEAGFGVSVTGTLLTLPGGGEGAFRGMPECPYVEPRGGAGPALFEPGLAAGRNQPAKLIASNLPSYLRVSRRELPVLAALPAACTDGRLPPRNTPWPFAAGGDFGRGRVLVMADHSVFINEMMLQTDNDNIGFAYRCADWLLARPGEPRARRDQVLYFEDGAVQAQFDIPLKNLPAPPLPPPATLIGLLDEWLHATEEEGTFAEMEEDDVANGAVADLMDSLPLWEGARPEWKLWTLVVIVASAALGLYGFVRLGTFRHRAEAGGPLLSALLEKQAPAGPLLAQRQEALLRDGNLWEAARGLARQLFASAGASPEAGPAPPAIEVRGPWWRRWQARRRWRELWRLARSARPVRVSPRGFTRLAARVRALRAALADGTIVVNSFEF